MFVNLLDAVGGVSQSSACFKMLMAVFLSRSQVMMTAFDPHQIPTVCDELTD